jgi:glycosyltransferase involved in cell wall biosynthesis
MQAMDLFVMASRSEGLCRALIEAMQVGLCPVVSDAGGMKELVRHDVDGMVFASEDDEALASRLRRLMVDETLRHRLASSAQHHAQALCSPGVVTDKLLELYAQALGKSDEARPQIVG